MKRIRIHQLRGQSLLTRHRRTSPCPFAQNPHNSPNRPSSTQASQFSSTPFNLYASPSNPPPPPGTRLEDIPSPLVNASLSSAKLAALHARLALPQRFPLQTLARTLVDRTADRDARFNNSALATLGSDVMGYYMSEHLICHYPRLPMDVLFAAQEAYVGPKALMTIAKEWGVEEAAEPGGEVDPGLLQFRLTPKGGANALESSQQPAEEPQDGSGRANQELARSMGWRRGMSSRIVYDDQFGMERRPEPSASSGHIPTISRDEAHAQFVRALVGAIHLHTGRAAAKKFFQDHFLSRVLNLSQLFDFRYPTRDLSRLCLREGFEPPVARLISETGRHSAHPVFVVGVYSGRDKLGEAVGGSLVEAKNRAAAAALKGWYLYSPTEVTVPSETEDGTGKEWRPNMIDIGEIIT
ncbi:uncharacterized protein PV09_00660 [Verruconis gallopava]|uniref:Large ribosomal subunit protein mL44 n=1 Tax=Verruconis gallopava TaxID=253628 RepID=A0A0D1Z6Y0_9PEZI|nr:uncharacterized protein PV09_00660 [Verruconis gallopava]KIW08717.1 hypothetical protein PV09_00660 [Verruconis gallopava]